MPDAIDLEILDLLGKLGQIQQVVGGAPKGKDHISAVTADGKVDRFIDIRNQMVARLSELKETMDLKNRLEKSPGSNPKELITAQSKIRTELATLQDEFKDLDSILSHETKKKRSKFTPEELQMRQQMLTKLHNEIEGVKEVKRAGYVKGYQGVQMVSMENHEICTAPDGGGMGGNSGSGTTGTVDRPSRGVYGERNNDMTAEHRMQLHQIKERDAQIVSSWLYQSLFVC